MLMSKTTKEELVQALIDHEPPKADGPEEKLESEEGSVELVNPSDHAEEEISTPSDEEVEEETKVIKTEDVVEEIKQAA